MFSVVRITIVAIIVLQFSFVLCLFLSSTANSESIDNEDCPIVFKLFTRTNVVEFAQPERFDSTHIRADLETKIAIHGGMTNMVDSFVESLQTNYLATRDCNVIAIGWPSRIIEPAIWIETMKTVASQTARLIDHLHYQLSVPMSKIHIIAHSIASHIAGIVGRLTHGRIGRISGLDPALLVFGTDDILLDANCAQFVDVIHTAIGTLGMVEPLGHVDFYPNNGEAPQPGTAPDWGRYVSHSRAYTYFVDSIVSPRGFWALECDSWEDYLDGLCPVGADPVQMGDPVSPEARGVMFLRTNATRPFALGMA